MLEYTVVLILLLKFVSVNEWIYTKKKIPNFILQTFGDTTDDSVSLNLEDNVIDGKFSSFAKTNVRLSRQSNIELSPSRTISSLQYQRLIEVNLLIKLKLDLMSHSFFF
jgi:hypothetical protein